MKTKFMNLLLFMSALSFAGEAAAAATAPELGGGGSLTTGHETLEEGDVEVTVLGDGAGAEAVEGEAVTPNYSFQAKLADAINVALGNTTIDNPGQIVVEEFCSWLYRSGIEPDVFASLETADSNATVDPTDSEN